MGYIVMANKKRKANKFIAYFMYAFQFFKCLIFLSLWPFQVLFFF